MDLWLVLLAVVLTGSALASGIVDRAPISFPIIFLGIGLVLGHTGFIPTDPRSPVLVGIATVSLALVLFLDAVKLDVAELRLDWRGPLLSLGPGTLIVVGGVAIAAYLLEGIGVVPALLLGATLASTDPIVLRDVIRDDRIPRSIRRALSVEAGMNDVVVLPIVLVLIALATAPAHDVLGWAGFLGQLLVLSPLVGLTVGGVGAWVMGRVDGRFAIRQEYQALYGLGLVLLSYSAAQAVGGDGFLAAFFGGLAVTIFDVPLCECFLEYGEATAEMAMLLAFLLFGAVLSRLLGSAPLLPSLGLAVIALGLVRPLATGIVLHRARMSRPARAFIGWFGPRGLSSLLLALLVVEADVPDGVEILAVVGLVVIVSVVVHGTTAMPLTSWYANRVAMAMTPLAEEREGTTAGLFHGDADGVPRVAPEELARLLESDRPPVVLDVRSRAQYALEGGQIPGSVRVPPDRVQEWAAGASHDRSVVAYCT